MKLHLGAMAAFLLAAVLTGCGASASAPKAHAATAPSTAAEVSDLLGGIPQHGSVLGDPHAPVTVQYFGDLECPFCRRFTLAVLPLLIQRYVRAGKLKITYRSLETATRDPEVFKIQQAAALAAGEQDKLWNFIEFFYHEQREEDSGYVTESYLQGLAQQIPGLNLIAWTAARDQPRLLETLARDERAAQESGLDATPSFRIGGPTHAAYYQAILALLGSERSSSPAD